MSDDLTTMAAVQAWITDRHRGSDPFTEVARATEEHRQRHDGCEAFAGGDGVLLTVLAKAIARGGRVLEIGTALGYSALCLSLGAGSVETVEAEPEHAALARELIARHRRPDSAPIEVLEGSDLEVVAGLPAGAYDLVFYDAAVPGPEHLAAFDRVLAPAGAVVTSNLFLGVHVPDDPRLPDGARYRDALFGDRWTTAFVGTKALTVRSSSR